MYDTYYQTDNLFGEPYPKLIDAFSKFQKKTTLLDLGCGQGRDAIALARLGFSVIGIDISKVGIKQLNKIAEGEHLPLKGVVGDIYQYELFDNFDYILLDNIFHFQKRERKKETELLEKILSLSKSHTILVVCLRKTKHLDSIVKKSPLAEIMYKEEFTHTHTFQDYTSKVKQHIRVVKVL